MYGISYRLPLSYSKVSLLTRLLLPLLPTSTSLGLNPATQLACAPVFSSGQLITMLVVAAMYSYALLILPKPLIKWIIGSFLTCCLMTVSSYHWYIYFLTGTVARKWVSNGTVFLLVVLLLVNGTRQGGVLSAYLFSRYIRGLLQNIVNSDIWCYIGDMCVVNILAYADDIVLLCPSWKGMQSLIDKLLLCA